MLLTIIKLVVAEAIFGNTKYATFDSITKQGVIIPIGISHNLLTKSGARLHNLMKLDQSQILVKNYDDPRSGQLVDTIQRVLDFSESTSTTSLILIGNMSGELILSEQYKNHHTKEILYVYPMATRMVIQDPNTQNNSAINLSLKGFSEYCLSLGCIKELVKVDKKTYKSWNKVRK